MANFTSLTLVLALVSALGYAVVTVGLKMGSVSLTLAACGVIAIGLVAALGAEMTLLRSTDLGIVYMTIIAVETLVVLVYAWWIGEGLSPREMGGAALILAGMAVLSH